MVITMIIFKKYLIESIYSYGYKVVIIEIFYINDQSDSMTDFAPSFSKNSIVY